MKPARRAGGNLLPDIVSFNCVLEAYLTSGHLREAFALLNAVSVSSTVTTYALLTAAALKSGHPDWAVHTWHQMLTAMVPPHTDALNTQIAALSQLVRPSTALRLLESAVCIRKACSQTH